MRRFVQPQSGFHHFGLNRFDWHKSDLPRLLMPLLAGLLILGLGINQPRAENLIGPHEFIIPASDGYGTSECLATQSACGKVIADAWCESHGHAHAIGYSSAADITGALKVDATEPKIALDSVIVSCGN